MAASRARKTPPAADPPGKARVPDPDDALARVRFDAVDLAILEQLQADSKITNATLAERAGISPGAAIERVRKLEHAGVVTGYAARLDPATVGKDVCAIVHVQLREHGEGRIEAFTRAIAAFDEVQCAWFTTGDEDFILKVLVTDMERYRDFVAHRLSALPNLGRVRSSFCLSVIKDETRVPLDAAGA
ncbi:MAG: Lrp/AsnC family transcriptional regulator [Phycisphaerales bacterium]|nr:MAG: Lrp/AsnC family transcriptional regulator [Phycisphaerales bacterium]